MPATIARTPPKAIRIEKHPKHEFEGHQDDIWRFVFLQDNIHIVSGSVDGTMHKWDCETGLLVGEPWKGTSPVYALALSPDGKTIACGRGDGSVAQWDTNGRMLKDFWMGHSKRVWSLSWSPSGCDIVSGSDDGTILIRSAESGQVKGSPIKTNQSWVLSVTYSPSGDRIASGGGDNSICIWASDTGKLLVSPTKGPGATVTCVVWSSDGSKLYSASDKFARVFDSTSGTELHRFPHDDVLYSVALSLKHNLLTCVGQGGVAQLWDTESHQPLGRPFHLNDTTTTSFHVTFSNDGQYLAYSGNNYKITLWIVKDIAPQLKLKNAESYLDVHIPGQRRRNIRSTSPDRSRVLAVQAAIASAASPNSTSSPSVNGINNFFRWVRSSLDTKREGSQRTPKDGVIGVVDVPHGEATYGDVIPSAEDRIRPYSLFFCLSWFQKKEKSHHPPQPYDTDLMKPEPEDDILNVPAPTIRVSQQGGIELTPMTRHSQPEAGPSSCRQ